MSLQIPFGAPNDMQTSMDDIRFRAPALLAQQQVNPLIQALDSDTTTRTWRLVTVEKGHIVNGQRLENALWRLWAQQRLGIQRQQLKDLEIDWESLTAWNHSTLLGPLVVSKETKRSNTDLLIANVSSPMHTSLILPSRASFASSFYAGWRRELSPEPSPAHSLDPRSCLKRGSGSCSTVDSTSLSNSTQSSSSPFGTRRRVAFNACVVQWKIRDDAITEEIAGFKCGVHDVDCPAQFGLSEQAGNEFDLDTPPPSLANSTPSLSRIPTATTGTLVHSIESLPPMKLRPLAVEDGEDCRVIFVPPPGMESLSEADLVPWRSKKETANRGRSLQRRKSSLNLSAANDAAMERGLQELGLSPAVSIRENPISMDGEDCVMVTKSGRRRRKASSSFVLDDAGTEEWPPAHDEWVDINIDKIEAVESPQENNRDISPAVPDEPTTAEDDDEKQTEANFNRLGTITGVFRSLISRSWI